MTASGKVSATSAAGGAANDDTLTRFLREMAARLPLDRVVEAHVFPAIRQGGAETGVAVIAARRAEAVAAEAVAAAEAADAADAAAADDGTPPGGAVEAERDEGGALDEPGAAAAAAAGGAPPHGEVANSRGADGHHSDARRDESPRDEHRPGPDADPRPGDAGEQELEANGAEASAAFRTPPTAHALPERHTVFSARYRLTLKGPDRGRWEIDVVEEADAPLVTVDAVVRGVQRRAGEGADPERFTAEQLRAVAAGGEVRRP